MEKKINMNIMQVKKMAKNLKEKVGLDTYPVGVKFVFNDHQDIPNSVTRLLRHRYCQALMKARHGEHVMLDKEGISCPAAAAAFGFKPLPDGLKNGKGLAGFGITKEENVGIEMFSGMTVLNSGELTELYLFPLETAIIEPDIVVIEDQVEKLMWVALAYLNTKGGKRIESSTAILQAACVDATIIPYKQQRMNLSYGCYGCRDATDIEIGETMLGFPFNDFEKIIEYIDYLSVKAITHSRGKNAYLVLTKEIPEDMPTCDGLK
jgi:uncharacterized protein (DUF169 family)